MLRRKYWRIRNFFNSKRKKKLQELIKKEKKKLKKTVSYRSQFIDSAKFMTSTLSNLVNNLLECIHRIKCKYRHDNKKCQTCGIKYQKLKMI